jgi:hypothetical protein
MEPPSTAEYCSENCNSHLHCRQLSVQQQRIPLYIEYGILCHIIPPQPVHQLHSLDVTLREHRPFLANDRLIGQPPIKDTQVSDPDGVAQQQRRQVSGHSMLFGALPRHCFNQQLNHVLVCLLSLCKSLHCQPPRIL